MPFSSPTAKKRNYIYDYRYSHGNVTYADLPTPAIAGNCLGLLVLAFVLTVGYVIHNPDWVRSVDLEEHQPLTE